MVGLTLALSCGGGDGGEEAVQNGTLYADVWDFGDPDTLGVEAALYSDVVVEVSDLSLKINGADIEGDVWGGGPYPDFAFFGSAPKADPSNLSFSSSRLGTASATVKIPGPTAITSPEEYDTIPSGQDVNISWNPTACDFYWFDVDIDFYDGGGYYLDSRFWEGYTNNPSCVIPKDSLSYSGAAYAEVDFGVSPIYGPVPSPGTAGNITGDLGGFFYGVNQGDDVWFYVGTPVKLHKSRPRDESARRKEFLKSMKDLMEY